MAVNEFVNFLVILKRSLIAFYFIKTLYAKANKAEFVLLAWYFCDRLYVYVNDYRLGCVFSTWCFSLTGRTIKLAKKPTINKPAITYIVVL
jgi:hypothetical protein